MDFYQIRRSVFTFEILTQRIVILLIRLLVNEISYLLILNKGNSNKKNGDDETNTISDSCTSFNVNCQLILMNY